MAVVFCRRSLLHRVLKRSQTWFIGATKSLFQRNCPSNILSSVLLKHDKKKWGHEIKNSGNFWLHMIKWNVLNKKKGNTNIQKPQISRCSFSQTFSNYQPPFPPFFFFCGAFFRVAPDAAGFCCRGGTTLLAGAVDEPAAEPGLGEVGGLVAVLLASLENTETNSDYLKGKNVAKDWMFSESYGLISHIHL